MRAEVIIPTRRQSYELSGLESQIVRTAGCPVTVIHTGADASASVNRNLGLSRITSEVAVMVDDDIEFLDESQGWLTYMLAELSKPEVVMVSAQMLNQSGEFSYMTGLEDCGNKPRRDGVTIVPSKRLLTACCAFKHHGLRFDEEYIGSGFEDIDFCNQLAARVPDGVFAICHSARVVHRNECKNQRGGYWKHNETIYTKKWGKTWE